MENLHELLFATTGDRRTNRAGRRHDSDRHGGQAFCFAPFFKPRVLVRFLLHAVVHYSAVGFDHERQFCAGLSYRDAGGCVVQPMAFDDVRWHGVVGHVGDSHFNWVMVRPR